MATASDAGSGKTGPGKREASKSEQNAFLRDPDVQLMLRTKAGDDDAFSQLVAGYQDRLLSIFYHMLRDQAAAEDLVQEVFLRIYRARNGYQPNGESFPRGSSGSPTMWRATHGGRSAVGRKLRSIRSPIRSRCRSAENGHE